MKSFISIVYIIMHILLSVSLAFPEGLSGFSKDILIKKTTPESRSFIREYLEFTDFYNSKECLEYGKRTNQGQDNLNNCITLFNEDHGLTKSASYYLMNKSRDVKIPQRYKDVMIEFLLKGKKYGIRSCIQFYEEKLGEMRKEDQLRANEICKTFFQN